MGRVLRFLPVLGVAWCASLAAGCFDPMEGTRFACDPEGPDTCASGWVCRSREGAGVSGVCVPLGSCESSSDCDRGTVCHDRKCGARVCMYKADCNFEDICVPGDLLSLNPGNRYCKADTGIY